MLLQHFNLRIIRAQFIKDEVRERRSAISFSPRVQSTRNYRRKIPGTQNLVRLAR